MPRQPPCDAKVGKSNITKRRAPNVPRASAISGYWRLLILRYQAQLWGLEAFPKLMICRVRQVIAAFALALQPIPAPSQLVAQRSESEVSWPPVEASGA